MISQSTAKKVEGLVSIVVPVYNVERYVNACLLSIESQSYPHLEVILVDDGSTDGSSEICLEHAALDERIVYLRKENGGLSSARNFGIRHAHGDWLAYVDSDDLLDEQYIENLLLAAAMADADVAVCAFEFIGDAASDYRCEDSVSVYGAKLVSGREALVTLYSERYSCCAAWGKIARINLWRKVEFPEGRKYEDFSRIDTLFSSVDGVVLLPWRGYAYRKSGQSITATGSLASALDLIKSISELEGKLVAGEIDCGDAVAFKICLECTRLIKMFSAVEIGADSELWKHCMHYAREKIRQYWVRAFADGNADIFQRARMVLFRFSPRLAVFLLDAATLRRKNNESN